MTEKGYFSDLGRTLRERNTSPKIEISLTDRTLSMSLNLMTGFEGYENVSVTPSENSFCFNYFGMASSAFNIFLRQEYAGRIANSGLLTRLSDKIKRIRSDESFVHFDESRKKEYLQQLDLNESETDPQEIEKAFYFFLEAFTDKTRR